jgi:hypothetical protein
LVKLADDGPEDVRDYLQRNPFDEEVDSSAGESDQEDEEDSLESLLDQLRGISLQKQKDVKASVPEHVDGRDFLRNKVEKGTRLHLVCIENGRFKCHTQGRSQYVEVRATRRNSLPVVRPSCGEGVGGLGEGEGEGRGIFIPLLQCVKTVFHPCAGGWTYCGRYPDRRQIGLPPFALGG